MTRMLWGLILLALAVVGALDAPEYHHVELTAQEMAEIRASTRMVQLGGGR